MICPYCGEDRLMLIENGLQCDACGVKILRYKISIFGLLTAIIHCAIVFVYFVLLFYIIFSILNNVIYNYPLEIALLVFYSVLVLAFIDLTVLVMGEHLYPVYEFFRFPNSISHYETEVRANKYLNRLFSVGAIIILTHLFYKMVATKNVTISFAIDVGLTLFGLAAILIAIGIWRKYQSEVIERLYRKLEKDSDK